MVIKYGSGPARENSTPNILITKWDTSIAGGTVSGIRMPFVNDTSNEYRFSIDWGDGTKESYSDRTQLPAIHTYDETGIYTIRVVGTILGWDNTNYFNQDDAKLIDILNWGPLTLKNINSFYGSTNLTYISADDYPNFRVVNGAGTRGLFGNCSNLTGIKNLASWTPNQWDINGDMDDMFNNCTNFNDSGLLAWDYTNITNMPGLVGTAWTHSWSGVDLTSCTGFNGLAFPTSYFQTYTLEGHLLGIFNGIFSSQTLSNLAGMGHVEAWNNLPYLTGVTDAIALFSSSNFSSSGDWVTGLDLSNIEDATNMFLYASNLNLDMSSFNLQNVKEGYGMFRLLPSSSQPNINLNCTGLENMVYFLRRSYYFTGNVDIDTSNVTNMASVFNRCYEFNNPSITGWDTSKVTNMSSMFNRTDNFNQDISNWNTSNVTNMEQMFYSAAAFNQPIGSWDVGKVQNMSQMLYDVFSHQNNIGCFDQDIGAWRMSGLNAGNYNGCSALLGLSYVNGIFNNGGSPSISGWVFGNNTHFNEMFARQVLFNQPIGPWDTSKITSIQTMLYKCDAFDQDLSNWVVTGITNANSFMYDANGLSTTNYDRTLSGWSSQAVQSGVNIHFGGSKYSTATGLAYRNALVASGWTITDGGAA